MDYEDGKFSKSRGVGVFGDNVMASGIPPEVWRYYLFSVRPESSDSQFLWASLIAANNNELLANFGNFVNRILKFINAKYDGEIPEYKVTDQPEVKLIEDVNALLAQYIEALEGTKIRQGLRLFMEISARGNQYLQENKIDNNLFANSRARCDNTVATAANLVYLLSALVYPYMPTTSAAIIKQLNLPQRRITDQWTATDILPGHQIGIADHLFKLIKEEREHELRANYAGKKAAVAETAAAPAPAPAAASGKSSKKAAKAASAAAPSVVPAGITKTPEMIELEAKITQQGDTVRQLKSAKAEASEIKSAVDVLLALKNQLASLTL
eukprot:jgi/Hompol1/3497/HPOL_003263-RA